MKTLNRADAFRILLGVNIALLLVHTLVESTEHNVNWLQIGERARVAQLIITVEGSAALLLGMALYERHYPEMMENDPLEGNTAIPGAALDPADDLVSVPLARPGAGLLGPPDVSLTITAF